MARIQTKPTQIKPTLTKITWIILTQITKLTQSKPIREKNYLNQTESSGSGPESDQIRQEKHT